MKTRLSTAPFILIYALWLRISEQDNIVGGEVEDRACSYNCQCSSSKFNKVSKEATITTVKVGS